ncbi:MAG: LysR substrate-binding domain-containing protein [Pseudomonadota bacterium]|nr:LysR substrate-binding domain-containing protein [Pseudomonadota bacterium]
MHFDLTDLRLFVRCAEEGAITRAAVRQHLSLAAASARIKALEEQAGTALLARQARGVRLTPPGEAFLHHARAVLRQTEQLRADLHEYGGGLRGHLRVFANTTAVMDFLPELLPAFLAAHPKVNVDLQEKPNGDIARGVQQAQADIGIMSASGEVALPGLRAIHFSTDQLVLVLPRGHRWARRRAMAFGDTLGEAHVGMHAGSTLHQHLRKVTEDMGQLLRLRIQLSSFDAVCRMVSAGVGVAVLPASAVRRAQPTLALAQVTLTDDWRWRERYVLVRDAEPLPVYGQALIDVLQHHHAPNESGRRQGNGRARRML